MLSAINSVVSMLPDKVKDNLMLFYFGHVKIPLVGFVGPKMVEQTDTRTVIRVPLNLRTKNHLGSLYFGALACAADVCAALPALTYIQKKGYRVHLSFKDFRADFLKRADGDTLFTTEQGMDIRDFIDKVVVSGQRMNIPVDVVATVPDKYGTDPVARFTLTISMKNQE